MESEAYLFDDCRAKKVIISLIKKDVIIYRKFIPDIEKMDAETLENLFYGETNYNYNTKKPNIFRKLLMKFDNFLHILSAWYKDDKYYKYLEELWIKYPSIEDLKALNHDENKLSERLQKLSINYSSWPVDIKQSFTKCINDTVGTKVMDYKKNLEEDFSQVNSVVKELVTLKDKFKETGEKLYEENAEDMALNLIKLVLSASVPLSFSGGNKAINTQKLRQLNGDMYRNCLLKRYSLSEKEKEQLSKEILECVKKENFTGNYNYLDNKKRLHDLNIKCKNGTLDNINSAQKIKAIFNSNFICGIHAALSFINLGWSVYELKQTFNGYEELKNYKTQLTEIKKAFEFHKKEIGHLPDDFSLAMEIIKKVIKEIREVQKNLRKLIVDIQNRIKFQQSQKNKSIAGLITSIGLGVFGVVGGVLTCSGVSFTYGVSSIVNVISGVCHASDIAMSSSLIDQFNQVLDEAYKEEELIQKEIDELHDDLLERIKEKIKEKIKQEPKFGNDSTSSISTQL